MIVKHLVAIQNFGSIDVLCSDKTGTLTAAAMTFDQALDWAGQPSREAAAALAYLNSSVRNRNQAARLTPRSLVATSGRTSCGVGSKTDEDRLSDFERRRLSIVVEGHDQRMFMTKGAPGEHPRPLHLVRSRRQQQYATRRN